MPMNLLFYGTRGAIMAASRDRFIYGGHTPCCAIRHGDDLLIVDAGFGIANLGEELCEALPIAKGGFTFHLLLTHFHWDHIQGLPFFKPIYFKGNRICVYTPFEVPVLREVLNLLLDGTYTPFNGIDSLPCEWDFTTLTAPRDIAGFSVSFHPTVHVGPCYAYRIEREKESVLYLGDHDAADSISNERLVAWARGAGVLIHEATYTAEEYRHGLGMGHSSLDAAVENARRIDAPLTLLMHNHALRRDTELAEHERRLEQAYNTPTRRIAFAREGVVYPVAPNPPAHEAHP